MSYDKARLGSRYTCFKCGTKFYDLNRPDPLCPDCGADQREAPQRDIKAMLSGGHRSDISGSDLDDSVGSDDERDEYDEEDYGANDDDVDVDEESSEDADQNDED